MYSTTPYQLTPPLPPRVEIHKEDDLSPDSDSDMMDVDTVSHDSEEKLPSSKPAGAGSKPECGFIVPEPHPHFSDMDSHVVFANNSIYSFFRLLQVSLLKKNIF